MGQARIIAELGINHNGSFDTARALIAAAADAGVWGVKFQYRNLGNAYAVDARQIGDEILQREIKRTYVPPEGLITLARYAQESGLAAGISFFTSDDIGDFGSDIGLFQFFKVPSVEFTNADLVAALGRFGKECLISTGAYAEADVARVLGRLDRRLWLPLHCVSNYPVAVTNPRLGYISHLRGLWGGAVGYSSHDEFWETCLLALQLGATVIERHITLDKAADGLDHSSSSTPDEFAKLVAFADNLPLILAGDGPRVPNQGELLNLQNLGRSYYAKEAIAAGEPVTTDRLVLRSPRTGLGQEQANMYLGKPAVKPIAAGAVIDRAAFEPPVRLDDDVLAFARAQRLSIPVRFHDIQHLSQVLPVGHFEFHLSFGDIERAMDVAQFSAADRYSVHLPDYVASTTLMDPFSPDADQCAASLRVLDRTVAFADALQQRTGARVPVVGSFSVVHGTLADFYRQHAALIETYRSRGVEILPQWLPPIAWYFGGAVRLKAMNNMADIGFLKSHQLPICLDVCHLCMGDKVFDFTAADVVRDLAPLTAHVHLADALGHDGEGVAFGEGDPSNRDAITAALALDCMKVIEVWQGHLHGGQGFARALIALKEMSHGR